MILTIPLLTEESEALLYWTTASDEIHNPVIAAINAGKPITIHPNSYIGDILRFLKYNGFPNAHLVIYDKKWFVDFVTTEDLLVYKLKFGNEIRFMERYELDGEDIV